MGCGSCRVSEMDSQFFKACRNNTISVLDFDAYLTAEERKYWINELAIEGIPQNDFWDEFKAFNHSSFTQISKDINRTFPTLKFFSSKPNVERFELLLRKFTVYFPKIGYTQGLNFIAGYLLLCGFNDQQAFRILIGLAVHENMFAIGLYEDQFPLNRLYCEVFWNLMDSRMPKVAQKIRKAKVPDQIWIFQWFISFFLYSFPTEYVKRWWNFNIWKKEMAMVLIALGIVKCLKNQILNLKNPDEFDFIQLFQNTKDVSYCQSRIDSKKLTTFVNSFTFQEIEKALQQTTCHANPYRKYFLTPPYERKQLYIKQMKHFKYERTCFKVNPDPRKYSRTPAVTNHLEDLMLSKYKLYQSEFKKSSMSNSMFKMSTFSINIENNGHVQDNPGRRNNSNPFSRQFLNKVNFAQSKVLSPNSYQFGLASQKKSRFQPNDVDRQRSFSPGYKKKPISPIQESSERETQNYGVKNGSREYDFTKKLRPQQVNF